MIGECIHCGARGPTIYGACPRCISPRADAVGIHLDAAQQRRKGEARARKRTPTRDEHPAPIVLDPSAPVPRGLEARSVVDWVTGRVAGVVAYRRDESASAVEDVHRAACREAGVWTPTMGRGQ
jgi:hypothetical protein